MGSLGDAMARIKLLSRIKGTGDAELVITQASIVLFAIAVIVAMMEFGRAGELWDSRVLFTLFFLAAPVLFIWGFHSKLAAAVLLFIYLTNMIDPPLRSGIDWMSFSLTLIGFLVSCRALEAAFKLKDKSPAASDVGAAPEGIFRATLRRYQEKSRSLYWLSVILPPLLLTPLVFIPFDLGSSLFWMPVLVVLPVSVWHISQFATKAQWERLIRPILALSIIAIAMVLLGASRRSADDFGRAIALEAHQFCGANGRCPEIVKGSTCVERPSFSDCEFQTNYGNYGSKYLVKYAVSKDRSSFRVLVRHNIDESLILHGGTQAELKEELTK